MEGVTRIFVSRILHTLSCAWEVDLPHVTSRTPITHLLQHTTQQVALEVTSLHQRVRVTALLLAHELVLTRVLTHLGDVIEEGASAALERRLQPAMFHGDARVIFAAIAWVDEASRSCAAREATYVPTQFTRFIEGHPIRALVSLWLGTDVTASEEFLGIVQVLPEGIGLHTGAGHRFPGVADGASELVPF